MARTLYLHIGPAKTGTSALQDVLRRHDNSVVVYPKVGLWNDGSHHNLVLNFFHVTGRPELILADANSLFATIGAELAGSHRDLVISSEALAGRRDLKDFVEALQRHLGAEPYRVEIVVVVREHFERAASLYNQRVKDVATCERRDPDQFLLEQIGALVYRGLLRKLGATGYDISVLNYHPAQNCVARVLSHIGFAPHQIDDTPLRNISLSRKALVATLAVNRIASTPGEREKIFSALRRMPGFFSPSEFIFGKDAAAVAEITFSKDRALLNEQFGIEFPVPDLLATENSFVIDEQEIAEIADATRSFGSLGVKITEDVHTYLGNTGRTQDTASMRSH